MSKTHKWKPKHKPKIKLKQKIKRKKLRKYIQKKIFIVVMECLLPYGDLVYGIIFTP